MKTESIYEARQARGLTTEVNLKLTVYQAQVLAALLNNGQKPTSLFGAGQLASIGEALRKNLNRLERPMTVPTD